MHASLALTLTDDAEDGDSDRVDPHAGTCEHLSSIARLGEDQPQKDVLGSDRVVLERTSLALGEHNHLPCAVSEALEHARPCWSRAGAAARGLRGGTLSRVRQGFAHDAVIVMDERGDLRAPGAAITVELCGHWDHKPPCPLAPHHTSHRRERDTVRLRTLFATDAANEADARARIVAALERGELRGPDGRTSQWQLRSNCASVPRADEEDHLRRLADG